MRGSGGRLLMMAGLAALTLGSARARELSFEDRVAAQAAVERVYFGHQIGATMPFSEAVPRAVLERKVSTALGESAALEMYWHTPVTQLLLERELDRIVRRTRMPERLREIDAALGGDVFLWQEVVARATLVHRLARRFYAYDPRFHEPARRRAEEIRRGLIRGDLDPRRSDPRRTLIDLEAAPATFRDGTSLAATLRESDIGATERAPGRSLYRDDYERARSR